MGNSDDDPGAATQMFQAFVDRGDRPTDFRSSRSRAPIVLALVAVAVVACVVLLFLLLG